MENQATANSTKRFIKQDFDKFQDKTTNTWIDPYRSSVNIFKRKWLHNYHEGIDQYQVTLDLSLRNIKTPNQDTLLIDYEYSAQDWIFIRNGDLRINLDNIENIILNPTETSTSVLEQKIKEVGYFEITKAALKKICDAKNIEIRVTGSSQYVDIIDKKNTTMAQGKLKFHFMCRSFYSDLYNDQSYDSWINSIVQKNSEGGYCFIATATMGSYNHPVVMDLRMFRDNWLLKRNWGISFTDWYYTHAPKAAKFIEKSYFLKITAYLLIVKPLQIITKRLK